MLDTNSNDSDSDENEAQKERRSRIPNLTCFKKKKEDASN